MHVLSSLPLRVWCRRSLMALMIVALSFGRLLAAPSPSSASASSARQWVSHDSYRSSELRTAPKERPGFTSLAPETTGVRFTNQLSLDRSLTNHILMNGSGVACGDVNGDGWTDIYLCNIDGDNALYLNQGDWTFKNIATEAGVACSGLDCTGAVFADLDGDQDLDLLVTTVGHGVRAFLNQGGAKFTDATDALGLTSHAGSMSAALADFDNDGDLDLYVVNYRTSTIRDEFNLRLKVSTIGGRKVVTSVNGRPATDPEFIGRFTILPSGGFIENGQADEFYLNEGSAGFKRISFLDGRFRDEHGKPIEEIPYDWGLSVLFRDLNGDGHPDLYVCNDLQSPDRIWINQGDGTFRALGGLALRQTSWFSMGADIADLNHDGKEDVFVADMLSRSHYKRLTQDNSQRFSPRSFGRMDERLQTARNTLFLGRGNTEFAEAAWFAGLAATDWSWSPVFLDVDLDGYDDLLVTTGFERDVQDMDIAMELEAERAQRRLSDRESLLARKRFPSLAQPNLAYRNRGNLTFEETGRAWGFDLNGVSQGIALADLDNDGDLDVVLNNMNAAASLLRNNASAPRIAVRLQGKAKNTSGAGARIRLKGEAFVQQQEITVGGRYLSGDDTLRTFAAVDSIKPTALEVRWRSGETTTISNPEPNHIYWIQESDSKAQPPSVGASTPTRPPAPALFSATKDRLSHVHRETPFEDFQRQPLLPRRLSQLGPGITWFDVDADGWDDLILGAGRGGKVSVYRNNGAGGFTPWNSAGFPVQEDDSTTLLGWESESVRSRHLLVGTANWEEPSLTRPTAQIWNLALAERTNLTSTTSSLSIANDPGSCGPMVMADVDLDGRLDLFVGGRVVPGKYPEGAASRLFRGTTNGFVLDADNSSRLVGVGMVSGATFTDLNGDGSPDLALAVEWGSIRIFINEHGRLMDATAAWGMTHTVGWWNSIVSGDFNGDGNMDLAVGNWGRNHPGNESGALLLHGDLDANGTYDVVEAYRESESNRLLPRLPFDRLGEALPFLRTRFDSYGGYAKATLPQILGPEMAQAKTLEAVEFESCVYLNQRNQFQKHALPLEAQLSPVFGVVSADLNGDGKTDLFLAQNFFGTEPHTDRLDAGVGLVLLGLGTGEFRSLTPEASGIRMYGEQRGAAVSDFDGDGRVDLAIAQNSAETVVMRNAIAEPGLRLFLRLNSPDRWAVGTTVRPIYATGEIGPANELHLGSGYWSQDSSVLVIGKRSQLASLWIRWPGGQITTVKVPPQARDLQVDPLGVVKILR
mgnify:CR=1 FL=1